MVVVVLGMVWGASLHGVAQVKHTLVATIITNTANTTSTTTATLEGVHEARVLLLLLLLLLLSMWKLLLLLHLPLVHASWRKKGCLDIFDVLV